MKLVLACGSNFRSTNFWRNGRVCYVLVRAALLHVTACSHCKMPRDRYSPLQDLHLELHIMPMAR